MVDILLATYNGEKYLSEQIESIINQTYEDWILYIRDDGSKDNTLKIINEYVIKYPKKIMLIKDEKKGLGAKLNFGELIKYSQGEYCMFCDQDDVWLPNKIEITLNKMKQIEIQYGSKENLLVYTDLMIVNGGLEEISKSFWKYKKMDCHRNNLNYIMIENVVTGCTAMINKTLANKIEEIPDECIMHDWWIGIVASALGKIGIVEEATILYRQHSGNEIGAKDESYISRLKNKIKSKSVIFEKELKQMEKFYSLYGVNLNGDDKRLIEDFISIPNKTFLQKRKVLIHNKIFNNKTINNLKNFIFI